MLLFVIFLNISFKVINSQQTCFSYDRQYSKHSKKWTVVPRKETKDYAHVNTLMERIVREKLNDQRSMRRKRGISEDDPRNIAPTIAEILPPPTEDIVRQKRSRFENATRD